MIGREGTVLTIFVLPCPCRVEGSMCVKGWSYYYCLVATTLHQPQPPPHQGYDPCNESLAVTGSDNAAWLSIVNAMTTL